MLTVWDEIDICHTMLRGIRPDAFGLEAIKVDLQEQERRPMPNVLVLQDIQRKISLLRR